MNQPIEIDVLDLNHLGIIAGIVDEIGIVKITNQLLGKHPLEEVSAGHVVKALILNCLGFLTAPLYLFNRFFIGKATEHLIGEGVQPEHLNDSRIGRVLDQLHERGLTYVFMEIALATVKQFGVHTELAHLDSSSFCVQGEYINTHTEASESDEPTPIEITHGYSRDHRPELKQFTLDLITSGDGDVPLYLRVGNGNDADSTVFTEVIAQFQQQWKAAQPKVYVADAALYQEDNLTALGTTPWISRVPATIAEAQGLMKTLPPSRFEVSSHHNYTIAQVCSTYGGVPQRWLIVHSKSRQKSDLKQLDKRIARAETKAIKALQQLTNHGFACSADALSAAQAENKKLKYHQLTEIEVRLKPHYHHAGRPRKDELPIGYTYHIDATLVPHESVIEARQKQAGRFILATNLLDDKLWPPETILQEYKNQQSCERGFRFLKDPLFFASRVFVKKPQRVAALAMIMGLCLLVYTIGQRQLRSSLTLTSQTIPNQRGQPTERPTLRWVMQCFQSVHLILVADQKPIIKLNDVQKHILSFLGSACQKYYFLC